MKRQIPVCCWLQEVATLRLKPFPNQRLLMRWTEICHCEVWVYTTSKCNQAGSVFVRCCRSGIKAFLQPYEEIKWSLRINLFLMVNTGMWARQRSFVHVPTRKKLLLLVYYLILPHLCRCFLLMTAAAALPVWRQQLKVCVSSEGRPAADRQAPTHRYPAVALSKWPQKGLPVAAGLAVITPLPRHAKLTGSYIAPHPTLRG